MHILNTAYSILNTIFTFYTLSSYTLSLHNHILSLNQQIPLLNSVICHLTLKLFLKNTNIILIYSFSHLYDRMVSAISLAFTSCTRDTHAVNLNRTFRHTYIHIDYTSTMTLDVFRIFDLYKVYFNKVLLIYTWLGR